MRKAVIIPLLFLFIMAGFAQKPKPATPKPGAAKPKATPPKTKLPTAKATPKPKTKPRDPALEKAEFDKAVAISDTTERVAALQKFITSFPQAEQTQHARELIVAGRAALGDEKLQGHNPEAGIALFKLAISEAPSPIPDKLYNGVIANLPANLFYQGQREASIAIAQLIEEKTSTNAKQLLSLAAFYIGIERGADAKRVADKIITIDPAMPDAYQTLGLAYRMNFQPDESAQAYAKALELNPDSIISKRSLAEMKRSLGRVDEAAALYREILAAKPDDAAARTGLILCLFDAEKKEEAEAEMARALEKDANNLPLLAGAAYWYAAHENGAKAIEIANKAIVVEPRYVWAHIALARGYMSQKKPLDAERVLLSARQYGNFPTLEYEIASARLMAGFYREAAEELKKSFAVEDGLVQSYLGGRVAIEAKSFIELIGLERQVSIFEPLAADNPENAGRLKALLNLNQELEETTPNEERTAAAAEEFIKGDDKMKFHRQLYAAAGLLRKKTAISKALEIIKAATLNTDNSVEGPNVTSAILADQLYESRAISMARNELVLVPTVPRQMLLSIVRGKIEDMSGWAEHMKGNNTGAILHLRRAVAVMPDKSAWWRSSLWRLAMVLEADGKDKEALDSYIKSYNADRPDGFKYLTIETAYKKVYGNTDGLEAKVGANPSPVIGSQQPPTPAPTPAPTSQEIPNAVPVASPDPKATPEVKSEATPESKPTPEVTLEPTPGPPQKAEDTPVKTEPAPEAKTEPASESATLPKVEASPSPSSETGAVTEDTAKPAETKTDPVSTDKALEPRPAAETTAKNKPLFDPVIITIPNSTPAKPSDTPDPAQTETAKPADTPENKPDNSGAQRPRVVAEKPATVTETLKCSLNVSQETVSLINNGGTIGLLVGFDGEGELEGLTATSSSPSDVDVVKDPAVSSRRKIFFIVRSVSTKTGDYKISFESSCGKKEITVKVN